MLDRLLDPLTVLPQVEPRLNRLFDLGVVPTLPAAVFPKNVELVGQLRAVEDVARIGIAGHQTQRLALPRTTDQDRRMGPGQRLRRVEGASQPVVRAVIRPVALAPHLQVDLQSLLQPLEPLGRGWEEQSQSPRLVLVPCRADAE